MPIELIWIIACFVVGAICAAFSHAAGKFPGAWAWGFLLGPLGIIIAAIIGVGRRIEARSAPPASTPTPPAARDLPPSTIARPCRQCGETARRPAAEWADAVRCANCGQVVPL